MAPYVVSPRVCVSAALIAVLPVVLYTAGVILQSVLYSGTARSLVYMALVRIYFVVYALYLSLSRSWFARSLQVFALSCSRFKLFNMLSYQHLSPLVDTISSDLLPITLHAHGILRGGLGCHRSASSVLPLRCGLPSTASVALGHAHRRALLAIHDWGAAIDSLLKTTTSLFSHTMLWQGLHAFAFALLCITGLMYLSLGICRNICLGLDTMRATSIVQRRLGLFSTKLSRYSACCLARANSLRSTLVVVFGASLGADVYLWYYWRRYSCGSWVGASFLTVFDGVFCSCGRPAFASLFYSLLQLAERLPTLLSLLLKIVTFVTCLLCLVYAYDIWVAFFTLEGAEFTFQIRGDPCTPGRPPPIDKATSELPRAVAPTGYLPFAEGFSTTWLPPDYRLCTSFTAMYEVCGELGKGGYGFVFEVRRRSDGRHFAVKLLSTSRVHRWDTHPELGILPPDVTIALNLGHDNLLRYVDAYIDDKYFFLVQELFGYVWHTCICSSPEPQRRGRTLAHYIMWRGKIPLNVAYWIFIQLLAVVTYLHSQGIAHCDIKPDNILVDDHANIRLIDLGNAVRVYDLESELEPRRSRTVPSRLYRGTLGFMPPEVFEDLDRPCEPFLGDVYAIGMVLYGMVTGIPYPVTTAAKEGGIYGLSCLYGIDDFRRSSLGPEIIPLLELCLEVDPSKRISMTDLAHLFQLS